VSPIFSQSVYIPLNEDYYRIIDRYEIKQGYFSPHFHQSFRPLTRQSVASLADSLMADSSFVKSKVDWFNLYYLANDNAEWSVYGNPASNKPILKHFYQRKADFYHYESNKENQEIDVHVNPILQLAAGKDRYTNYNYFLNVRGAEVRATVAKKIGFYSSITETQVFFPEYIRGYVRENEVVPGQNFWKRFRTNGTDFITATGYITFNPIKPIQLQFGHDRNAVGTGYRSLILSDFSSPYLFLKAQTKIWKFNYTNLFAKMYANVTSDINSTAAGRQYDPKYMAHHHLSFNLLKNLNIGLFETIIFSRQDSAGRNYFDIEYLNPVMFYRSVEQSIGSPDNANLGMDFRWNFLRHFSLYGQLFLDEFLLKEVRNRTGWWANKQAGQLGFKYIDAFTLKNLDIQAEMNVVRPFTYSYITNFGSYTHFNQPLAHPLGANFIEWLGVIRYQPIPKLTLTATTIYADYGEDELGKNWGNNISLPYTTRHQEYNNKIGQGIATKLFLADLTASYQVKHNLFIDAKQLIRRKESALPERSAQTFMTTVGLRWNIAARNYMF
jgi:hypothetical protein